MCRVRNKKELNSSLKGATLGDADADTDDTLKWLKKSKKREKELARKRQAELESMDKIFQGDDYTESESFAVPKSYPLVGADALFCSYLLFKRTWRGLRSAMTSRVWMRERHGYLRSKTVVFWIMKVRSFSLMLTERLTDIFVRVPFPRG